MLPHLKQSIHNNIYTHVHTYTIYTHIYIYTNCQTKKWLKVKWEKKARKRKSMF